MAKYDASINLLVTGQQKVEALLSSVDRLQSAISSIKSTPVDLNIKNYNDQLKRGQERISGVDEKINRLYTDRISTIEKIAKLNDRIAQKDKIIADTTNTTTKKYQEAVRIRNNAIEEQTKLQDKLNESIDQSNRLSGIRSSLVSDQESIRALRQQVGFARTLANSYLELGDAKKYTEGKGFGGRTDLVKNETSIAQIKQQAATFEQLANNTRIASREFNRFTVAAQLASQKSGKAQLEQLSVLAEAFSPAGQIGIKPRFSEREIAGARSSVSSLIGSYSGIAKSEAALSAYADQLRAIQSLVPYTSNEFRALEEAIAAVNQEISGIGSRGQKSAIQAISGPATDLGSLKAFQQRESYQKRVNDQLAKQVAIEDRINRANISDSQKLELRNQLESAATALAEDQLSLAQRLTRETDRQRMSMERANRPQNLVVGALGTSFMPVSGRIPGVKIESGSPADKQRTTKAKLSWQGALAQMDELALQIKQTAEAKGSKIQMDWNLALEKANEILSDVTIGKLQAGTKAATKLGQQQLREIERTTADLWKAYGGPALPPGFTEKGRSTSRKAGQFSQEEGQRKLTYTLASGAIVEQSLINLQNKGVNVTDRLIQLQNALNGAKQDEFDINVKNLTTLSDEVALAGKYAQLQRQIAANNKNTKLSTSGYPSSPIRGGVNMPGSPIYKETPFLERKFGKRGAAAISEGLIGGAFPLLFGQGIGASAGGLIGGAAGGFVGGGLGFGLSLLGTTLGTAFDQLSKAAQDTGKALRYPIEGFEKLKEASLFASKQQEFYIQKLIDSGRATEAAALIQKQIASKIGVSGVKDLQRLGDASDRLGKAWGELGVQIQAILAGPLAALLEWTARVLSYGNDYRRNAARVKDVREGLSASDQKVFDQKSREITALTRRGLAFGGITTDEAAKRQLALAESYASRSNIRVLAGQQTPEQQEAAFQKARQVADEIKSAYREAFQIQRQGIDIEIQAAENRRKVENDIFAKRQEIARLEADNARTAADLRIQSADLALRKSFAGAEGEAATILGAVREYIKISSSGEADIAQKKRDLTIKLADIQQETSNYIYEQAKTRLELERRIEDYKKDVSDYQYKNQLKIQELQGNQIQGIKSGSIGIAGIASTNLTPAQKAVLATVRYAEGTAGPMGYQTMFGGGTFSDMSRHPNKVVRSGGYASAAAGAYQFMPGTWNQTLGGGAMTPQRQDAGAIALMLNRGADINKTGFTREFANKISPEWASFPTLSGKSYYGQPVKSFEELKSYYDKAFAQYSKGQVQMSPLFNRPGQTAAQAGVKVGDKVGFSNEISQYQQASSAIRPITPSLEVNQSGQIASQNKLKALAKERFEIEKAITELGIDASLFSVQEAARGQSNIIALTNQRDLEKSRYEAIVANTNAGQEQLALIDQQIQQQSQLNLAKAYETSAIEIVNQALKDGVITQEKAAKITREIQKGTNLKVQSLGEESVLQNETLQLQQKTAFAQRLANIERQGQLDLITRSFNYIGPAARAFREELDLSGSVAQAQQIADAVQRIETMPGRQIAAEYDTALTSLQKLATWENVAVTGTQAISNGFGEAFRQIAAGTASTQEILAGFFQGLANSFADMAAQMIANMIQVLVYKQLLGPMFGFNPGGGLGSSIGSTVFGGGLASGASWGGFGGALGMPQLVPGLFASGGMFDNIKPFASGGMVSSPTLFKFADGGSMNTGVMGEAGPEAILPLSRGSDGKLGVTASGGGSTSVTVNVDASGSKVQGDNQQANQLGKAVASAVQEELIRQKRPGGLLA